MASKHKNTIFFSTTTTSTVATSTATEATTRAKSQ